MEQQGPLITRMGFEMKRPVRWIIFAVALFVVSAASISISPRQVWRILGMDGRPVEGAFVAYYFRGQEFHVVETGDYSRSGKIGRSDGEGRVRIPWTVHVHLPFPLQTNLAPFIEYVYAPPLHNMPTNVPTKSWGGSNDPEVRPGCCVIDRQSRFIRMENRGPNPDQWYQTLQDLESLIARLLPEWGPHRPEIRSTLGERRELVAHLRREYETFLAEYADARRELPPPSPRRWYESLEDYQARRKQREHELANPVSWGNIMKDSLKQIERLEGIVNPRP